MKYHSVFERDVNVLKKVIRSIIFSIVVLLVLTVSASAAYYGDVNGDGKITSADARAILRVSAKLDSFDDAETFIADVNGDNKITSSDARLVLRMSAKLDSLIEIDDSEKEEPTTQPNIPESTTQTPPETTTQTPPATSLSGVEIHDIASKYTVEVNARNNMYISTGSGFFMTADGKVVTNYHVIDGMYEITVTDYNGITYNVIRVLAFDAGMDIAVLQVNAEATPAVLNYSTPRTGATAYTLGSSKGMTDTFTNGIISNGSRVVEEYHPYIEYIQTTAPISQGNSGGPLINDKAEVIGINTWMRTDGQNLNFAIPVKYINELDYSNPLTMSEFADIFKPDEPGVPEVPDDPGVSDEPDVPGYDDTITEIPELEVRTSRRYLKKGGTAVIEIEIIGRPRTYDLYVNYNTDLFSCEWDENWYTSNLTGNDIAYLYVSTLKYTSSQNITIYVDGYKDETSVTIPVSATTDGWYDYGGYVGAVDYGAFLGVAPYYCSMGDETTLCSFYYSIEDLALAGHDSDDMVSRFFDYLESCGYVYVETTEDDDGISVIFYNEEYDIDYGYFVLYDDYGVADAIVIVFEYR